MDKKITLAQNIQKQKNLLAAIERLSLPEVYGAKIRYKWGYRTPNKKHFRRTLKNYRRLTKVIHKQSLQEAGLRSK